MSCALAHRPERFTRNRDHSAVYVNTLIFQRVLAEISWLALRAKFMSGYRAKVNFLIASQVSYSFSKSRVRKRRIVFIGW